MKRVFIVKHQPSNPPKGTNTGIKRGDSYLHQTNCHFV